MDNGKDIDNLDLVLHHRQKRIEGKLIKILAAEIAPLISQLVVEKCGGCINVHLSQTHHQCLTMEMDEKVSLYFDTALERVSETKVLGILFKSIKPNVNELFKYMDWKTTVCTEQRSVLKQETFKLL